MSVQVVAAVIALAGVLVSAGVAFVVSRRQTAVQIRNLRVQLAHEYTSRLFQKRLEVYPDLYKILHDLGEAGREGPLPERSIEEVLSQLHAWDGRNAVFLSAYTLKQLIRLRALLARAQKRGCLDTRNSRVRSRLVRTLINLEIALKTELGVFSTGGYHNPSELKSLSAILADLNGADYEMGPPVS